MIDVPGAVDVAAVTPGSRDAGVASRRCSRIGSP